MKPTYAEIMSGRVVRGNWRRADCVAWGVGYPPPHGFPNSFFPQTDERGLLLPCTRGMTALVDPADYESASLHLWHSLSGGRVGRTPYYQPATYFRGQKDRLPISLGRFLLDPPAGLEVDHINGDPFDNRRLNLRLCTHNENVMNRRKFCNTVSQFKGVYSNNGLWQAAIGVGGKRYHIGTFATAEEAAAAYDRRARELHGEFANVNAPLGDAA